MSKMEVFFDYMCPFCLRGYEYLKELTLKHPQIEIIWRPCEVNPRPGYIDPRIQGLLFALDNGADPWQYSDRVFDAIFTARRGIRNAEDLIGVAGDLLNTEELRVALKTGKYSAQQTEYNDLAYERSGVWALPAFRMNGKALDSIEGVGVSKAQLDAFMGGEE